MTDDAPTGSSPGPSPVDTAQHDQPSQPGHDDAAQPGHDDAAQAPPAAEPAGVVPAAQHAGSGRHVRSQKARKGGFWRELPVLLGVALVLALLIKAFLVQAFYIPSGSMERTLEVNDRVLVNKLVYDFRDIRRGEIVVFDANGSLARDPDAITVRPPSNPVQKALNKVSTTLGFGVKPGEQDYIKRVIGIPGDRVACCDSQGRVTVQPEGGTPVSLDEPYVNQVSPEQVFCANGLGADLCPPGSPGVLVPEGRLFVMGDHRDASADSRFSLQNNGGTVAQDQVIGRAFVVVWPLNRFDWLGVPGLFDDQLGLTGGAAIATPYALAGVGVVPLWWLRRRSRRKPSVGI
ncbi:MAG: signal peptidase [Frankiales bacterium]|nr:signal peptidase [Frankiales bacterium]